MTSSSTTESSGGKRAAARSQSSPLSLLTGLFQRSGHRAPDSSEENTRYREHSQLMGLVEAAHVVPAAAMTLGVVLVAAVSGRSLLGVLVAGAAVLVGQLFLGILNDVVDRHRDREVEREGKPIADQRLLLGNATYALAVLALLLVPLSLANGTLAGLLHLGFVVLGVYSTMRMLVRGGVLSPVPWALSFGMLAFFLAYGGVGGGLHGDAPRGSVVVLAMLLGVGVHFLRALPDLVQDNRTGVRHLPLRLALRLGAPRLLLGTVVVLVLVGAGLIAVLLGAGLTAGP